MKKVLLFLLLVVAASFSTYNPTRFPNGIETNIIKGDRSVLRNDGSLQIIANTINAQALVFNTLSVTTLNMTNLNIAGTITADRFYVGAGGINIGSTINVLLVSTNILFASSVSVNGTVSANKFVGTHYGTWSGSVVPTSSLSATSNFSSTANYAATANYATTANYASVFANTVVTNNYNLGVSVNGTISANGFVGTHYGVWSGSVVPTSSLSATSNFSSTANYAVTSNFATNFANTVVTNNYSLGVSINGNISSNTLSIQTGATIGRARGATDEALDVLGSVAIESSVGVDTIVLAQNGDISANGTVSANKGVFRGLTNTGALTNVGTVSASALQVNGDVTANNANFNGTVSANQIGTGLMTFTPSWNTTGTNPTYAFVSGVYKKTGKKIWASYSMQNTSGGTAGSGANTMQFFYPNNIPPESARTFLNLGSAVIGNNTTVVSSMAYNPNSTTYFVVSKSPNADITVNDQNNALRQIQIVIEYETL